MINLLGWGMRDYLTFSDTEINLSHDRGLYVVSGKNLDSSKQGNANAVGKSRLLSCIPTVRYESDPLAVKNQKNKKDVLRSKSSETSLIIGSHHGQVYRVRQTPTKYFVEKRDEHGHYEDQKALKLEVARRHLSAIFPLSENTFYATSYIQSQRECRFQRAKPADRLTFITEIFNLEVYDKLRKHFAAKLSELAKVEIEYKAYAQQLNDISTKIKSSKWTSESKDKLDYLNKEIGLVRTKLKDFYEQAGALTQAQESREKLESLRKKLVKVRKQLPEGEPTKELFKQLKSDLKQAAKYASYIEDMADYKTAYSKLTKALKALPKTSKKHSLKSVESDYDKQVTVVADLKAAIRTAEDQNSRIKELQDRYDGMQTRLEDIKANLVKSSLYSYVKSKPESKWISIVSPIVGLAELTLDLASQISDHDHVKDCPLCGSSKFNTKDVVKRIATSKAVVAEFVYFEQYFKQLQAIEDMSVPSKVPTKKLKVKYTEAKEQLEELRDLGAVLEQRENLQAKLDELVKPKKVEAVAYSEDELSEYIENLQLYLNIEERIKDLCELPNKPVGKRLEKVKTAIKKLKHNLDKYENDERILSLSRMEYRSMRSQKKEAEARLAKLEPLLKDRELYSALKAAYSPNCLKLQAADKIVNRLEESLNRYSSLVYLEPMRFEIRTDKSGITAIAIRNNGERSDISQLSGAETNCFRLLFALSLLPLLPEDKRTNFLVLDEPDSACSPVVRSHLIREFLPKLCEVVPHVFWLTPGLVDEFQNHILINVIKENGTSHVEIVSEV